MRHKGPLLSRSMKPRIGEYSGLGWTLECPSCGGEYLHHDRLEVFECGEDAEHGTHVVVENGRAVMDSNLTGNPSKRRHGLRIQFWCEMCDDRLEFTLVQHKGNTFVDMSVIS